VLECRLLTDTGLGLLVAISPSTMNPIVVGDQELLMAKKFKVGDHVSWNSEAGRVSGRIIRVHTKNINYRGYTHHASTDDPQYEIRSDKTDHLALHKGRALRHLR
jgi:hypothetical protein